MIFDISNLKVGDKCWSIQLGDCKVVIIDHFYTSPITCENSEGIRASYRANGKYAEHNHFQSLFPSNPFAEPEPTEEIREEPAEYMWGNFYLAAMHALIVPFTYNNEPEALRNKCPKLQIHEAAYYGTYKIETKPAKKFKKVIKWEEVV